MIPSKSKSRGVDEPSRSASGGEPALPNAAGSGEGFITAADVAEFFGASTETVRAMARRGELKSIRLGAKMIRFRRSDIDAYLRSRMSP